MELKIYLRILLKKWWIIVITFLVTFTATAYFTFTQTPVYEASATFLVVPQASEIRNSISIFNLLSSRSEIASTYAEIAASHSTKKLAADALNLSPAFRKNLTVNSQLLAGTTVLRITAQGSDPELVRDFTNQIGTETIHFVQRRYETFSLEPLDLARLPENTIRPNIPLNLALGVILGSALGVGLAFLAVYLQAPTEQVRSFGIIDEETGVYNKRYFTQRLAEEMSRARRNGYPLSLAVMNVDHLGVINSATPQVRSEALRRVSLILKQQLREEDLMAHFGRAVFAFLLPDMSGISSQEKMEKLQARIAWTPLELENSGVKLNLSSTAGVSSYQLDNTNQDELLNQAMRALEEAEIAGFGKVQLSDVTNGRS